MERIFIQICVTRNRNVAIEIFLQQWLSDSSLLKYSPTAQLIIRVRAQLHHLTISVKLDFLHSFSQCSRRYVYYDCLGHVSSVCSSIEGTRCGWSSRALTCAEVLRLFFRFQRFQRQYLFNLTATWKNTSFFPFYFIKKRENRSQTLALSAW